MKIGPTNKEIIATFTDVIISRQPVYGGFGRIEDYRITRRRELSIEGVNRPISDYDELNKLLSEYMITTLIISTDDLFQFFLELETGLKGTYVTRLDLSAYCVYESIHLPLQLGPHIQNTHLVEIKTKDDFLPNELREALEFNNKGMTEISACMRDERERNCVHSLPNEVEALILNYYEKAKTRKSLSACNDNPQKSEANLLKGDQVEYVRKLRYCTMI